MEACDIDIFAQDSVDAALRDVVDIGYFEFVNVTILNSEVEYIEAVEGARILVASAVADAILNGTAYTDREDFNRIVARTSAKDVMSVVSFICDALKKVIGDKSELKDFWLGDSQYYPVWQSNIQRMIERLSV